MLHLATDSLKDFIKTHYKNTASFQKWLFKATGGDIIGHAPSIKSLINHDLALVKKNPDVLFNISRLKSDKQMLKTDKKPYVLYIYNRINSFAFPLTPYRTAEIKYAYTHHLHFSILNHIDVSDIVLNRKYWN